MGDLFQALNSGLARFVYAWLLPSVLSVAAFILIVWPQLKVDAELGSIGAAATVVVSALGLSVVFAYGSRPIFQVFEGYLLPAPMKAPLLRRQQRRFLRLQALASHGPTAATRNEAAEALRGYPDEVEQLLPTRMGNALRGLETYGASRYGLDSQTFWYELQATSSDKVWKGMEEAQSAVDFFMSSLTHFIVLATACVLVSPWSANPLPALVTATVCLLACPLLYAQTVTSILEWRFAVQAVVNLSRPALADGLGLVMPDAYDDERQMWVAAYDLVIDGPGDRAVQILDLHRRRRNALSTESTASDAQTSS